MFNSISTSPTGNTFTVETELINKDQTERLVQKVFNRNNFIINSEYPKSEKNSFSETDGVKIVNIGLSSINRRTETFKSSSTVTPHNTETRNSLTDDDNNEQIISNNRKCLENILENVLFDSSSSNNVKSSRNKSRSKTFMINRGFDELESCNLKKKRRSESLEKHYVVIRESLLSDESNSLKKIIERHVTTLNKLINQIRIVHENMNTNEIASKSSRSDESMTSANSIRDDLSLVITETFDNEKHKEEDEVVSEAEHVDDVTTNVIESEPQVESDKVIEELNLFKNAGSVQKKYDDIQFIVPDIEIEAVKEERDEMSLRLERVEKLVEELKNNSLKKDNVPVDDKKKVKKKKKTNCVIS